MTDSHSKITAYFHGDFPNAPTDPFCYLSQISSMHDSNSCLIVYSHSNPPAYIHGDIFNVPPIHSPTDPRRNPRMIQIVVVTLIIIRTQATNFILIFFHVACTSLVLIEAVPILFTQFRHHLHHYKLTPEKVMGFFFFLHL